MKFDKEYYTTLNYVDYLHREQRYYALAKEVTGYLSAFSIIDKNSKILDYGSAVGHLLVGLNKCGYNSVYGYDISEWANQQAIAKKLNIIQNVYGSWDLMFSLDVFEHMTDDEIYKIFIACCPKYLIARIPCAESEDESFYLDISKKDPTHINCKTRKQWIKFLSSNPINFSIFLPLHMLTIYDAPGVFSFLAIR
jgi:hypothetical protein